MSQRGAGDFSRVIRSSWCRSLFRSRSSPRRRSSFVARGRRRRRILGCAPRTLSWSRSTPAWAASIRRARAIFIAPSARNSRRCRASKARRLGARAVRERYRPQERATRRRSPGAEHAAGDGGRRAKRFRRTGTASARTIFKAAGSAAPARARFYVWRKRHSRADRRSRSSTKFWRRNFGLTRKRSAGKSRFPTSSRNAAAGKDRPETSGVIPREMPIEIVGIVPGDEEPALRTRTAGGDLPAVRARVSERCFLFRSLRLANEEGRTRYR